MGLTHFDEARRSELAVGHLHGTWSTSARPPAASGSACAGSRSRGRVVDARPRARPRRGDLLRARRARALVADGARPPRSPRATASSTRRARARHTLHALTELDVLAFGPRDRDESPRFPRLGARCRQPLRRVGCRRRRRLPVQFVREAELGPPELPAEPGRGRRRSSTSRTSSRKTIERPRDRADAAQPRPRGRLGHDRAPARRGRPGKESAPAALPLARGGDLRDARGRRHARPRRRGDPGTAGHVVSRPAGTGVSHLFRAGDGRPHLSGLRHPRAGRRLLLPGSNKINFGGVGVIGRVEKLDYWDGED